MDLSLCIVYILCMYICMYMYLTNTLKLNIVSSIIKTLKMWLFGLNGNSVYKSCMVI